MSVDVKNLRRVVATSAAAVAVVQGVTASIGLPRGRRDYVDAAWGPGLATVAVTSALVGNGDPVRRLAFAVGTSGWAARLATLMVKRFRSSDEEDPRYQEFLEGDSTAQVIAKVYLTQGLAQLLVSAPIQLAAASPLPRSARRWLFPAGLAVMVAGAVVEAVGDRQKDAYTARPRDERPPVLDTGLWAWSRHPNYLGDSIFWDGVWLASAASPPTAWTLPAPIAMNYLLIYATGAKRTERRMQERPAYRDYQDRVSFFFPTPPKQKS